MSIMKTSEKNLAIGGYVILNEKDTKDGVVESYSDAKKCAKLFKENKEQIKGI